LLDPILFGPDPTARARVWIKRRRWDDAETAFAEAVRARTYNTKVLIERGLFYSTRSLPRKAEEDFVRAYSLGDRDPRLLDAICASPTLFRHVVSLMPEASKPLWLRRGGDSVSRQQWSRAAADYFEALQLEPDDLQVRHGQILLLLAAGDTPGLRSACSTLLEKLDTTTDSPRANLVVWCCLLGSEANVDCGALVRLAELALGGAAKADKGARLRTLGAALYRAGQFEEAIQRLGEGIQIRGGKSVPQDWSFLALAHHRLGDYADARRWLDKFRDYVPSEASDQFWNELEIRLLRSEAENVVHYDLIFPTDPFAR
jgi:tetratricopeptide (TPR) repeat protein